MDLLVLADVPVDGAERSRIKIASFGRFSDPRYGRFAITREMADAWKRNLEQAFNGEIAIDLDHSPEKRGQTEAAGWVKNLEVTSDGVYAEVEWTSLGADAIRDRRYRYISPTFLDDYKDERGKGLGPTLVGVALTNRPFLRRDMPAVSLSEDELSFASAEASDSRRQMTFLEKIAKALKLDDADEAKVLAAIEELGSDDDPLTDVAKELELSDDADAAKVLEAVKALRAETPPEPKKLEEQAAEEGKIALDRAEFAQIKADAERGKRAAEELHEQKFTQAFAKALSDGRVDAREETRERFYKLYDDNAELTLETLAELPPIVRTQAAGSGRSDDAPEGHDSDRYALDRKVKAYMAEHKVSDYGVALDAVLDAEAQEGALS